MSDRPDTLRVILAHVGEDVRPREEDTWLLPHMYAEGYYEV